MASIYDALLNDPDDQAQNAAMVRALRRQQDLGTLGQLMGTAPTTRVGESLQQGAGRAFREAMDARRQAKRDKAQAAQQEQAQKNWKANYDENVRQFNETQKRLNAPDNSRQFAHAVDPITGTMRLYNVKTGEWSDGMGGTQPNQEPQGAAMGPTGFPQLPAGIKMPENATKSYIGASQLAEHLPALETMVANGYAPNRTDLMAVGPPMSGTAGRVQDLTPRGLAGPEAEQYFATGGKILTAILRPESGGAITQDEWNQYGPLYLPWPGDDGKTAQRKLAALRQYMRRLAAGSGPASRYYVEPPPGKRGASPDATQGPRPGDKYLE